MPETGTHRLVRRRVGRTGHSYQLDGKRVPGVTTILNAMPKQLAQWAADCGADYAIEHWDELSGLGIAKRHSAIRYAYKDARNKAAARGTDIHKHGEALVYGTAETVPDELRGAVEAYARFLDEWKIEPVATETPVCSTTHMYGGTSDMTATIGARDGMRALVDLKTGNVYETAVLQLAAYRYADLWQPDGPASETTQPDVDAVFVARIMPDDVQMLPVDCGPAQLRQFLYVQQTSHWLERHGWRGDEPLIGEAQHA
jgi:hypothetical protein